MGRSASPRAWVHWDSPGSQRARACTSPQATGRRTRLKKLPEIHNPVLRGSRVHPEPPASSPPSGQSPSRTRAGARLFHDPLARDGLRETQVSAHPGARVLQVDQHERVRSTSNPAPSSQTFPPRLTCSRSCPHTNFPAPGASRQARNGKWRGSREEHRRGTPRRRRAKHVSHSVGGAH